MGMSTFMQRYGGGAKPATAPVLRPTPAATRPAPAPAPQTGMGSFMSKWGGKEENKGGYSTYEDDTNRDNEQKDMEAFVREHGRVTEEFIFTFPDGEVVAIRFDKAAHKYYRIDPTKAEGEEFVLIPGVSTIVGIKDKSFALMPWAANETAGYVKAKFLELNEAGLGAIMASNLHLQEWLFTTLDEAAKNYKELSKNATDIGRAAHEWIEHYINAVLSGNPELETEYMLMNLPDDPRAASCCEAAVSWMKAHNVRWVWAERLLYSRRDDCGGTADGLCLIDSCGDPGCKGCDGATFKDVLSVIDWKSSNALYSYYRWQAAKYKEIVNELWAADLQAKYGQVARDYWVIQLGKDDGKFMPWRCPEEDTAMDIGCFEACLILQRESADADEKIRAKKAARRAAKKAAKLAAEEAEKKRKADLKVFMKSAKEFMVETLRAQGRTKTAATAEMRAMFAALKADTDEIEEIQNAA
jgi:hypothetical protein